MLCFRFVIRMSLLELKISSTATFYIQVYQEILYNDPKSTIKW